MRKGRSSVRQLLVSHYVVFLLVCIRGNVAAESRQDCSGTLLDELTRAGGTSTFAVILDLAGQLVRLGDTSYEATVFVPQDLSIVISAWNIESILLEHPEAAEIIASRHLVEGNILGSLNSLEAGSSMRITSSMGEELSFTAQHASDNSNQRTVITGTSSADSSQFQFNLNHSVKKCNGILHYMNKVLPPPSVTPEVTPGPTGQPTPSVSPKMTPSPTDQPTPSAAPEMTPSTADQPTPPVTPEVTPSAASTTTDQAAPPVAAEVPPSTVDQKAPSFQYPLDQDTAEKEESSTGACSCATEGQSGGVSVPSGCLAHRQGTMPFCYVSNPSLCDKAVPSEAYYGAAWRSCEPEKSCGCTKTGISGDVNVPIGCARYANGDETYYCYISDPEGCASVLRTEELLWSSAYHGAAAKECSPEDIPACACSRSGLSNGVLTGRPGCATHHSAAESNFCYTVDGENCPLATASEAYSGAAWRFC